MPFKQPIKQIENLFKCWSIESPQTKQLTNKVQVTLQPFEEFTIVIVLKTPSYQREINLMTLLKITQNTTITQKSLETGKRTVTEDSMQVILCGRLENPIVFCNKALVDAQL